MVPSLHKTVLFTRPNFDLVTNYLFYWSSKLIEEAEKKSYKILDLSDRKANPKELNSRLTKMLPELCVINGHGSPTSLHGHDNIVLVDKSNAGNLKGSIVYARSCSTGAGLGVECVKKGVRAYIGYAQPFWLCYDKDNTHHPLDDKLAQYALIPSNQVVTSLLKGNTAGQAAERSQQYSRDMMRKLMSSDAPDGASGILSCVWTNMRNQVCIGDEEATI